MSDTQQTPPEDSGLTIIPPQEGGLTIIPAGETKPEDLGTLSLRYVDGVPMLVVNGGTAVPAGLTVVDGAGNTVTTYVTSAPPQMGTRGLATPGVYVEEIEGLSLSVGNLDGLSLDG
ncbi:hypothetical protein [Streptomyces sp. NBC_00273]|uniref:hypothetical protein n=1 Tax=Streptomyces sp. NBC_00273 TaxID=2903644 RepID=UPI002E2883F7|nr:hypothetical protein [Streptomyces sp. NBC_00273]